jgi:hypothetical protein
MERLCPDPKVGSVQTEELVEVPESALAIVAGCEVRVELFGPTQSFAPVVPIWAREECGDDCYQG